MFLISSSALGIYSFREGGKIFKLFLLFHLKFSALSKTPTKEGTEGQWITIYLSEAQLYKFLTIFKVLILNPPLWDTGVIHSLTYNVKLRQKGSSINSHVFKGIQVFVLRSRHNADVLGRSSEYTYPSQSLCHHQSTYSYLFIPCLFPFPSRVA